MNERGQATPLLALAAVAVGGLIFGLGRFGATATHAAQAQSAADAAALAAVAEGRAAGEELASDNGGEVVSYETIDGDVQVRARVGDAWAVAGAARGGGGSIGGWVGTTGAGGDAATMSSSLRAALEDAAALLHQPVPFVAASGTAVDVPGSFAARLNQVAARVGLCRLPSTDDPVRFAMCPDRRT